MAAFPTVWAAANAISLDLAGLPIRIQLGEGSSAEVLPEHPFLDLLARPSSSCTERRLRRQLYVDETLTGNGIIWLDYRGDVPALRRLHPQHAIPEVNGFGDILQWTYGSETLSSSEVHLVAGPSWSDDASMVLGESPIRPLEHDLEAMRQSKRHAARAARSGRPDFHFSAPADSPLAASVAMNKVVAAFEDMLAEGKRAVFTAGGLTAEQLTWPLRDLEYKSVVELSEKAALIVLGTPAVRLGLPNANYGEAKVQMRQYWEGLIYRAAAWDDALTPIARALDPLGRPVRVRHDPTNIEALQHSFDQRQQRAAIWVQTFGADPAEAARYEGFPDAPTGEAGKSLPRRPAQDVDELQEARRGLQSTFEVLLRVDARLYDEAEPGAYPEIRDRAEVALSECLSHHGLDSLAAESMSKAWAHSSEGAAHIAEQCAGHPAFSGARAAQMARQATALCQDR